MNDNELIAEFLGCKGTISNLPQFGYMTTSGDWKDEFTPNELKFHKNWNWLMEVVEKIEGLNYSLEINKQEELDYQCLITQKNNIIIQKFNQIKIQAVYQAVVEFINQFKNN